MAREDPQLKFRVPAELREALEAAATAHGRSLSAEIVHRLEQSFASADVFSLGEAMQPGERDPIYREFRRRMADRENLNRALEAASANIALKHKQYRDATEAYIVSITSKILANAVAERVAETVDQHLADLVISNSDGSKTVIQTKRPSRPPLNHFGRESSEAEPGIPGYDAKRVIGKQTVNVAPTANPAAEAFFDDIEGWMRNAGFDRGVSLDAQRAAQSEAAEESAKRFMEANKPQKRRYSISPGLKAYWRKKAALRRARKTDD